MPSRPDTPPTLAFAQHYLELGLHPIPVEPRGKKPSVSWKRYQTQPPTAADLEKWFGRGSANVGLVLGRGLIAVDLDGEGAEELLTARGIKLPSTAPRARTGNGHHVLLRVGEDLGDRVGLLETPERRPDDKNKALAQVDIRGIGFIVAPPSVHPSGRSYEWIRRIGKDIPLAPAQLVTLIKATGGRAKASPAADVAPGAPKWVAEALGGVGEGKRDATCARLAGYFLGKGIPEDVVKQQLYAFGERCAPVFPRDQVDKTVESVLRRDVTAHTPPATEFQILGYNQGSYFYLPRGSRQVVELGADQHKKLHLLQLAPLQYWEQAYMGKQGVQWDMAANALIRQCERAGVYDTSRIRGRGAWWDPASSAGGGAVLHLGDSLVVDGQAVPIMNVTPGRYIYEAAPPMPIELDRPLTVDEANQVVQICELIPWERPISARLLAGWVVLAPICGALSWRPHVWLTGAAGSGKTWVIDNIIRRLIGNIGLAVQSETTEAGLRQTLGHDARPIIFDEAEGEDQRAQLRIQNILALMRQASSETGAIIIKGTTGGTARTYRIRSCFAFSSIGVGVQQHADATRVSVLSVIRDDSTGRAERFRELEALTYNTLTEDYVRRFIARAIRMAPVIRANARTFAAAGAEIIGSQRLGDQIGALLAGCYSLFEDGEIPADEARDWVGKQDWSEQQSVNDEADESKCLQRILEKVVRVPGKYNAFERSIGELILVASIKRQDEVTAQQAADCLARMGVRVERDGQGDCFTISSSHGAIGEILAGTAWARGWARLLRRIEGAESVGSVRFAGTVSRGVSLPLELL